MKEDEELQRTLIRDDDVPNLVRELAHGADETFGKFDPFPLSFNIFVSDPEELKL